MWLCSVKDPGSKLMRWRLQLAEYQYKIMHKASKLNLNADALSHMYAIIERNQSADSYHVSNNVIVRLMSLGLKWLSTASLEIISK